MCVLQGKILMLITNSDFAYTNRMMSFAYDEYLPEGKTWRDLFDMVPGLQYLLVYLIHLFTLKMLRHLPSLHSCRQLPCWHQGFNNDAQMPSLITTGHHPGPQA